MIKNIKKIFALTFLLGVTISFSGCLNLGGGSNSASNANGKNGNQGIFKSVDGGRTWEQKVKIDEKNSLDKMKISSMEIDPQDNKVLYVGTIDNGLYKTKDGTDTWEKVTDSNGIFKSKMTVNDIAVEKGNSDTIYIATVNGGRGELLKSEDGGKSWVESYIITQTGKTINHIEIDPIFRNVIYIGTEQGGLLKSDDRGIKWVPLNWFKSAVRDFVIDYQNTKGIIVRTGSDIQKTKDGGNSWEVLAEKMKKSLKFATNASSMSSMTIDNVNPLVVYITYLNLILITRDGGDTWDKLDTITPELTAQKTIPQIKQIGMIDDIIYYGAGNALYKSDNKGVNWFSYSIPIKGDVRYTISDPTDYRVIYLGAVYEPPKKKK